MTKYEQCKEFAHVKACFTWREQHRVPPGVVHQRYIITTSDYHCFYEYWLNACKKQIHKKMAGPKGILP